MLNIDRYSVYEPVGNKWRFLFAATAVNKEGGVIEQLEDIVKTGPDARVAIIIDTAKNRHVPIFRMNINNQTRIKALSGGWKDGDGGVLENTLEDQVTAMAEDLVEELKVTASEEEPLVEVAYEGQPDYVVLNWFDLAYGTRQYIIPMPTEKQLRVLNIAHGNFIGDRCGARITAALTRVLCAIAVEDHQWQKHVEKDERLEQWVGLWKDCTISMDTPLRFENATIEIIFCGANE